MFEKPEEVISQRLANLKNHLKQENPVLVRVVDSFQELDRVGYKMGLIERSDSFATRISWWPLVSVLGTFSSGKSSFINHLLGEKLQRTGNQAVDNRFTVLCYSREDDTHVLPGLALDSDPRLPFYQISERIERAMAGEGMRIDSYLQLKTCTSERLRGKILIDSPGFDADAQRTSTLRITEHIIDLSDLVLVFFDARHPEPGAMRDTLSHLVGSTIHRSDAGKFLYILNQIDTAAAEDNAEEVVGSWQRAMAEKGLTAGHFFVIYNPESAVHVKDDAVRTRFKAKRDAEYAEVERRIERVQVERAYRIVGALELTARDIENRYVPTLRGWLSRWRSRVLVLDLIVAAILVIAVGMLELELGVLSALVGAVEGMVGETAWAVGVGAVALVAWLVHHFARGAGARQILRRIARTTTDDFERDLYLRAFRRNSSGLRSIFGSGVAGWGRSSERRTRKVLADADRYIQTLNDNYADPSGGDWEKPVEELAVPKGETTGDG